MLTLLQSCVRYTTVFAWLLIGIVLFVQSVIWMFAPHLVHNWLNANLSKEDTVNFFIRAQGASSLLALSGVTGVIFASTKLSKISELFFELLWLLFGFIALLSLAAIEKNPYDHKLATSWFAYASIGIVASIVTIFNGCFWSYKPSTSVLTISKAPQTTEIVVERSQHMRGAARAMERARSGR